MRIVDEWTEQDMRVTVLIMNGRYSLKLEKNLLEQTYKFRDGQIEDLAQLKSSLSEEFYKGCSNQFIHMNLTRTKLFKSNNSEELFVEII